MNPRTRSWSRQEKRNIIKEYDERYSGFPFDLRPPGESLKDKKIFEIILNTDSCCDKRLLELGCGLGHTTIKLSRLVDVVGVDFSEKAIKVASNKTKSAFVRADVQALPFKRDSFYYAIAKDVFEHVPDDDSVFEELSQVCKYGAILVAYLPCELDGINFSTESFVKKLTGYTIDPSIGHLRRYKTTEIIKRLRKHQFETVSTWHFAHLFVSFITLASVISYDLLSKRKKEGEEIVSGLWIPFTKLIFGVFEILGRLEQKIFRTLPGAGFFLVARKVINTRTRAGKE